MAAMDTRVCSNSVQFFTVCCNSIPVYLFYSEGNQYVVITTKLVKYVQSMNEKETKKAVK